MKFSIQCKQNFSFKSHVIISRIDEKGRLQFRIPAVYKFVISVVAKANDKLLYLYVKHYSYHNYSIEQVYRKRCNLSYTIDNLSLGTNWGRATVLKCIPGFKLPIYSVYYTPTL